MADQYYKMSDVIDQQGAISEKLLKNQSESFLAKSQRIQIYYDTRIHAKVKSETKTILQRQQGLISSGSFTAILGPSGSGKTTLLNFLSGRLMSDNLVVEGEIRFNSQPIPSLEPYSNQIGYVMQEDSLLATLSPRECFQFSARLRLGISKEQATQTVQDLIQRLGLSTCADTRVGSIYLKGISGGQRKRTSIGVQLITNPSIIFLDEPTTGLDSTTALQVILLLKELAKDGKTIISTIHQPSSELFCEFDRLMLLVDGKCIYLGPVMEADAHFETLGYKCPKLMNSSQFYMDMMSMPSSEDMQQIELYEQACQKHDEKILSFETFYHNSKHHILVQNPSLEPVQKQASKRISFLKEVYLIALRSMLCQLRNPMDVGFKVIQSIFTSLILIVVFGKIDNDWSKPENLQNIRGVVFFVVATNAFASMGGTLGIFSLERQVFLRERFSKSYSTFSYFLARTGVEFPFELLYPTVGLVIIYWSIGMGQQTGQEFAQLLLTANTVYFCSASYGILYAAIIPKLQTAMALVPALVIPFMLLGGFFINLSKVNDFRVIFYPIMYLSPFRYGFQSGMTCLGLGDDFVPAENWLNIFIMILMGLAIRVFSAVCMQIISNPKRPRMIKIN